MKQQPLPVTDDDVLEAFRDLNRYEVHGVEYPTREPNLRDILDEHMLKQLRAVLENDRKRVAERININSRQGRDGAGE